MKDMSFTIPPEVLLILMRPDSTFDARKTAVIALTEAAWARGWDDCAEETAKVLAAAGLAVPMRKPVCVQ